MTALDGIFLSYFCLLNSFYSLVLFMSFLETIQRHATRMPEFDNRVLAAPTTPPITIIAPAYNEQSGIVESVSAFLQLDYPELQVVVVNDGSTDSTFETLRVAFALVKTRHIVRELVPTQRIRALYRSEIDARLLVVEKENGGKADSLNAGLNVARTPLVCCVDSDTLITRSALLRMVEPFLYSEERVVAVGGTIRVANDCEIRHGLVQRLHFPRSWLARFQVVEYLRAFLFGRLGYNRLGGNLIISGAFGLFAREEILNAGGYQHDTVGEDMELVVRLLASHRGGAKIIFLPDPVCYTEVPETIGTLCKQRDRWQRGLIDSLLRHRGMFCNPHYGLTGLVAFPSYVLFELFGPIVELGGYLWFAWLLFSEHLDSLFVLCFFVVAFGWGFVLSVQGIVLDELSGRNYPGTRARLLLLLTALLEGFGYRQCTLLFRMLGVVSYLRGRRSWGKMERRGFNQGGQAEFAGEE